VVVLPGAGLIQTGILMMMGAWAVLLLMLELFWSGRRVVSLDMRNQLTDAVDGVLIDVLLVEERKRLDGEVSWWNCPMMQNPSVFYGNPV
jgi:hypothetical protein